jgi:diamine N-acetyltransferase
LDSGAVSFRFGPLGSADARVVRDWPPYTGRFSKLDYALRTGGWLDAFPESATTRRFGVWVDDRLVGFSILTHIAGGRAEFYVAIHPAETGHGLGRIATERTVTAGFEQLGLDAIYLKVRVWHQQGIALYSKVGFRLAGEHEEMINGEMTQFHLMELPRPTRAPSRGASPA